jgi:hypothetical protein
MSSSNVRLGSSIIAHSSPRNGAVAPASRSGSTRRGSFSSSWSPSALARRLAGSIVTTATLAPSAAMPSAIAAEVVVLPTPPDPPHTHTRFPANRSEMLIAGESSFATIKIFKIVTVTGRNARFVPVIVSATKPRKFTAQIVPVKGKQKALATGRLTLERKHGGHGTIRVKLPAKVKPGTYFIVVRETTLKDKKVGKLIKIKFTLK